MDGRMTVSNMSIEWGARAGLIAPDDTTYAYLEGRPGVQGDFAEHVERWSGYASDPGAQLRRRGARRRLRARAAGDLGHQPRPDGADHRARARAARRGRAARARVHGPGTGHADAGHRDRPRLHRQLHEQPPRRPARGRRDRARRPRRGGVRALVVPGSMAVKRAAEAEGLDRVFTEAGFEWRNAGCSMCLGMNPDVASPASESPRPATATSRAVRARARARI